MNKNYGKRWQELCKAVQDARSIKDIGCMVTIHGTQVNAFVCTLDSGDRVPQNGVFPTTPKGLREAKEFVYKATAELSAVPEPRLTDEAQAERDDFNAGYGNGGCTCFVSPPCGYCTHPGNPRNQAESPEDWVGGIIGDCGAW